MAARKRGHVRNPKYPVTRFKNLRVALKEIEPMVRDPQHLQTGKPLEKFGKMRPREMLANWLLCATFEAIEGRELMFYSDAIDGDGLIRDEATEQTWQTEHVYVSRHNAGSDAKGLIIRAINQKQSKGEPYCRGKTLVVLLDTPAAGLWFPNEVAKALPNPLLFAAVWVVGFSMIEAGSYIYNLTLLDVTDGNAPAFLLRITPDFDAWHVEQIQ
jgi:hypothetical protein